MEADFAFLADTAEIVNNKVYVMGGAFDTIWAPNVPAICPRLSFVMRLKFNPSEVGRKHRIEINILSEDGKRVASVGGDLQIGSNPNVPQGWMQSSLTVLNFANLKFENFCDYSFELLVNDFSLKSIPLRVAKKVEFKSQ